MERKKRLERVGVIATVIPFLSGASSFLQNGKILFGIIFLMVGLINLAALFKEKFSFLDDRTDLLISFLNIVAAAIAARDYFDSGAVYLPYVWVGITIFFVGLFIFQMWKYRKNAEKNVSKS
ncbi:MAG: hypothetical protein MRZ79_02170 [Bacteroidia bacterium]|nr:hypothetical protein [Bacteroidia bacterium]